MLRCLIYTANVRKRGELLGHAEFGTGDGLVTVIMVLYVPQQHVSSSLTVSPYQLHPGDGDRFEHMCCPLNRTALFAATEEGPSEPGAISGGNTSAIAGTPCKTAHPVMAARAPPHMKLGRCG